MQLNGYRREAQDEHDEREHGDQVAFETKRLVLVDHKTDTATPVSVSAAVVGADRVDVHLDASRILAEAAAAVTRAKMNGGNRIERVPLPPSRER